MDTCGRTAPASVHLCSVSRPYGYNAKMEEYQQGVLALIPAYNEAAGISAVVAAARQYLPVLVVDDGSLDDTASLAEAAGAQVLRQVPNQGKGVALKAGFHWAIAHRFAAALTLDADGQHDPHEIPAFLNAYQAQQADLVIGQRDFSRMPPSRRLANTLGRWSFSWAVGASIPDNQSGYRLVSPRLMQALLESSEQGFEYEVEMIAICVRRGLRLAWVPIRTIYAGEASHIRPLHHIRNYLRILWKVRKK
jgi:glycosyltransferase involved in cell wall biosynthesis